MLRLWGNIDPGHAKLRELVGELIDEGLWRLLWMPPTLPYWPLEGPFEGKEHATKRLLFSAWNVVPDVVSAVLSYEAERLMTGGAARLLRESRRAAAATVEADAVGGGRSIPSPSASSGSRGAAHRRRSRLASDSRRTQLERGERGR